jgi:hypothetical protein
VKHHPRLPQGSKPDTRRVADVVDLLVAHAKVASRLAQAVEQLEAELLTFAAQPKSTKLLSGIVPLAQKVDGIRAALVGEIGRACSLALELERPGAAPSTTVVVAERRDRVVLAPAPRRYLPPE